MAKKQTKAEKEFIAKIATLGFKTGGSSKQPSQSFPETTHCPDCGAEGKLVGIMGIPIYAASGHGPGFSPEPGASDETRPRRERKPRKPVIEGDGFAA